MATLLVIDDDPKTGPELQRLAREAGFSADLSDTLSTARKRLAQGRLDVVLFNIAHERDAERSAGLDLLEEADLGEATEILLVTDQPDYRTAARGMRLGATDYFNYPEDRNRLVESINALGSAIAAGGDEDPAVCGSLVGDSPPMHRLYRLIRKAAPTEVTVFLVGDSGSGKELAARTVHDLSTRCEQPFVAVNCGAVPKDLIESELFGHEKGAFTGATKRHRGYFERAAAGTLFLDEVTEMSADLQVKLLRVLENQEFRRLGSEQILKSNARIVAATNRDPEQAVEQGLLREDLYYRLAEFPIHVPALRERGEDVVLLARHFLAALNQEAKHPRRFSEAALDVLRLHDWPGNVRELRNAITRAHILAEEAIVPDDLPAGIPSSATPTGDYLRIAVGQSLAQVERRLILATVAHFEGDRRQAAETLGISVKTLYNRLKKYRD